MLEDLIIGLLLNLLACAIWHYVAKWLDRK